MIFFSSIDKDHQVQPDYYFSEYFPKLPNIGKTAFVNTTINYMNYMRPDILSIDIYILSELHDLLEILAAILLTVQISTLRKLSK